MQVDTPGMSVEGCPHENEWMHGWPLQVRCHHADRVVVIKHGRHEY